MPKKQLDAIISNTTIQQLLYSHIEDIFVELDIKIEDPNFADILPKKLKAKASEIFHQLLTDVKREPFNSLWHEKVTKVNLYIKLAGCSEAETGITHEKWVSLFSHLWLSLAQEPDWNSCQLADYAKTLTLGMLSKKVNSIDINPTHRVKALWLLCQAYTTVLPQYTMED